MRSLTMLSVSLLAALAVGGCGHHYRMMKKPVTDDEKIANAMCAAPRAVAMEATIMDMDGKGQMRVLRQGTGPFTCLPDNPMTPGNDPMCLDKAGMAWAKAWMTKTEPPAGMVGLGYMLMGGSDASNDDPYATAPKEGKAWVETGPHIMILNPGPMLADYPKFADNPDKPYVMWGDTPYRHLMVPVR